MKRRYQKGAKTREKNETLKRKYITYAYTESNFKLLIFKHLVNGKLKCER